MKFWWCNQSNYWSGEFEAGVVCAQAGSPRPKFREMVSQARKGDIVVHYLKQPGVVAVSRVKADAVACRDGDARKICLYGRGWSFPTEYHLFSKPIPRATFIDLLAVIPNVDGPIQALSGGGHRIRQEYFMPFTRDGLRIIHRASTGQVWPPWVTAVLGAGSAP